MNDFLCFKIDYKDLEFINTGDLGCYSCKTFGDPLSAEFPRKNIFAEGSLECVQCSDNITGYIYRCTKGCSEFLDFCSTNCVSQHESERHCAVCRVILPSTITYCKTCGSLTKFCGDVCYKGHKRTEHCAYCDAVLGREYSVCKRCGSESPRYCNSYCFRHHFH
jgi:hypothetical protein